MASPALNNLGRADRDYSNFFTDDVGVISFSVVFIETWN